ncbi:LysR substrate-binding domain-containing protein, partial [Rhizobium ruizarguesonis]
PVADHDPQADLRMFFSVGGNDLGQADLAIDYNLPDDTRLQRAAEFRHALGAVVAPAHPLAKRKTVRMSDCLLYPLVLADRSL